MIDSKQQQELIDHLSDYIPDHKKNRIEEVLEQRTRHVTVVLEDIYKPHNASAVLRTCDCYGIQEIHIVEQRNTYDVNRYVTRGSAKWLSLLKYDHPSHNNIEICFNKLKKEGYKLYAISPVGNLKPNEIPVDEKIALVFGTEESGITDYVRENVDGLVSIPMYGFTESFNISVAAGIVLDAVIDKIKSIGADWKLNKNEMRKLKLEWYESTIKHAEPLIQNFLKSNTK